MDLGELWNSVNVEDGSVLGMKVEGDITPIALLSKIIVKVAGNYLLIDSYLLNPSDCNCRISGLSICPFIG